MEKVGIVSGTSQILKTFQSNVGKGFRPSPPKGEVTADRITLLGAIQVIQEKYDNAWKMKPGKKKYLPTSVFGRACFHAVTYTNMAVKANKKKRCRDIVYILPKGPFTDSFSSVWKALFKATVDNEDGQTAAEG